MSPAVMCMTEGRMTEGRVARIERLLAAGDPVAVIVAIVARHSVGLRALLSPRRPRSSAIARHVCWHLARRHTCRSLPEIGAVFGVDHSSVLYGIRRVAHWRAAYPDVGAWADDAEREILRVLA